MDWVASQAPHLAPHGQLGWSRNVGMLAFLATKSIGHSCVRCSAGGRRKAGRAGSGRRTATLISQRLKDDFLFGDAFSTADALFYVMVRSARELGLKFRIVSSTMPSGLRHARRCNGRCAPKGWLSKRPNADETALAIFRYVVLDGSPAAKILNSAAPYPD